MSSKDVGHMSQDVVGSLNDDKDTLECKETVAFMNDPESPEPCDPPNDAGLPTPSSSAGNSDGELSDQELSGNEEPDLVDDSNAATETTINNGSDQSNFKNRGNKVIDSQVQSEESCRTNNSTDVNDHPLNNVNRSATGDRIVQTKKLECVNTAVSKNSLQDDHGELDYEEDGLDEEIIKKAEEMASKNNKEDGEASEEEEGLCSGQDDDDDGEIKDGDSNEDAEDKEEGELESDSEELSEDSDVDDRQLCRFFSRGNCNWGVSCRFLHPGINDKPIMTTRIRAPLDVRRPIDVEPEPPSPPIVDEPRTESAWERGLRQAKEARKLANKRKETEVNFEEKKMNMTIEDDFNKENDRHRSREIFTKDPYYDNVYDDDMFYESKPVAYNVSSDFRAGQLPPLRGSEQRTKDSRSRRVPKEKRQDEIRSRQGKEPIEVVGNKRPDEWHDPWQRTKPPERRRSSSSSRSGSRGRRRTRNSQKRTSSISSSSFSSSRSRSYSSKSSRSSSRSSSLSSCSSRSRSPSGNRGQISGRGRGRGWPRGGGIMAQSKPGLNRELGRGRKRSVSRERKLSSPKGRRPGMPSNKAAPPLGPPTNKAGLQSQAVVPSAGRGRSNRRKTNSNRRGRRGTSSSSSSGSSRSSSSSSFSSSSSSSADSDNLYRDIRKMPQSKKKMREPNKASAKGNVPDSKGGLGKLSGGKPFKGPVTEKRTISVGERNDIQQAPKPKAPSSDRERKKETTPSEKMKDVDTRKKTKPSSSKDIYSKEALDGIPMSPDKVGSLSPQKSPQKHKSVKPASSNRSISKGTSGPVPQQKEKTVKDPLKLAGQKPSIKLTLIKKHDKPTNVSNKERKRVLSALDDEPPNKKQSKASPVKESKNTKNDSKKSEKIVPKSKSDVAGAGKQKASIESGAKPASSKPKTQSSRREELLKQLKAVEDAIARKRKKLQ